MSPSTTNAPHSLTRRIVLAMLAGVALGSVLNLFGPPAWAQLYLLDGLLGVVGTLFVSALKMMVVPLVFVSLVVGVTSLADLSALGRIGAKALALYLAIRFIDIIFSGKFLTMFTSGFYSVVFWIEIALFVVPMVMLLRAKDRADFKTMLRASMFIMLAGAMYRFDAYIVAFNPGPNWSYFPTTLELLITLGVIAFEIFLYLVIVKRYPILAGAPAARAAH